MATIPEPKDVFVGELAQNGDWVVANIDTTMAWPVKAEKFKYRGKEVWVLPIMRGMYPCIAINRPHGMSREDCQRLLMRFLSALSWVDGNGALVEYITGGNLPRPMGRDKQLGHVIRDDFDLSYLPEPNDEKVLLALALLREGRGLNHPGYAFLSSYRVLEVANPDAQQQMAWIDKNVDELNHVAQEALAALRKSGVSEIGQHLYASGRCAMAHAKREPIIDPDDPTDLRRLGSELPIIIALAERAIETLLGVETSHTVWKKHLYELDGFRKLLGPEVVGYLKRGEQIPDGTNLAQELPTVNVRIRRCDPYKPLERMDIVNLRQEGTLMRVTLQSADGYNTLFFYLNFNEERLQFDISNGIFGIPDDGSANYAENRAELARFFKDYVGNGQLQMFKADTGELISRLDEFTPVNCFLDVDGANANIERWRKAHLERSAAGKLAEAQPQA
jgi:hypothetical protein